MVGSQEEIVCAVTEAASSGLVDRAVYCPKDDSHSLWCNRVFIVQIPNDAIMHLEAMGLAHKAPKRGLLKAWKRGKDRGNLTKVKYSGFTINNMRWYYSARDGVYVFLDYKQYQAMLSIAGIDEEVPGAYILMNPRKIINGCYSGEVYFYGFDGLVGVIMPIQTSCLKGITSIIRATRQRAQEERGEWGDE